MDSLINSAKANNINILKGFEEKFTKDYARYLKKKTNDYSCFFFTLRLPDL